MLTKIHPAREAQAPLDWGQAVSIAAPSCPADDSKSSGRVLTYGLA
jgi:hypothetical protein